MRPGDDASITCTASGDEPIQISWAKKGQPYLPRSVYARNGRLDFRRISYDDQGRYVCTASNQVGTSEATAEVLVDSKCFQDLDIEFLGYFSIYFSFEHFLFYDIKIQY